ncbi:MAG: bacteriohemerythrin [Acidobacteria bacterium]|nr:bacteriohemerythrin [Acidobacteriota bacterium]
MSDASNTFIWRPSYSVGDPDIDAQHQQLIRMIDTLHGSMVSKRGDDSLAGLLAELIEYTHTHFLHEERLMIQTGYPSALSHRNEHDRLRKAVMDFQKDLEAGKAMISVRLMSFLKNWLIGHIQSSDRELGRHLGSAGVKRN